MSINFVIDGDNVAFTLYHYCLWYSI